MSRDTGGSAFPEGPTNRDGMTLRDYFAGQALSGVLKHAMPEFIQDVAAGTRGGKFMAAAAYAFADAMLAEREKAK